MHLLTGLHAVPQHVVHQKDNGDDAGGFEVVNLRKMGKTQRQLVVDRALATSEQSNEEFERKLQERVERCTTLALFEDATSYEPHLGSLQALHGMKFWARKGQQRHDGIRF